MTNDMSQITNEPITNDELAGLILGGREENNQMLATFAKKIDDYLTTRLKEQAATSVEIINNQSKAMRKFEDTLAAQSRTIEKLESIVSNMNYSTGNYYNNTECYVVLRMPENIRMDCITISPNKDPRATFREILKKMKEISSIDIDAYILKNSSGMKYARFSKSYFVSKDEILSAIYNKAVAELMNSEV